MEIEDRYREHFHRAVRLAFLLTSDHSLSEDVAQEAFMRVSSRHEDLDTESAFWGYVRVTVTNIVRKHWHRRRPELLLLGRLEPGPDAWQPDLAEREWLWSAIQRLPPLERIVIVLRYYESIPDAQIAEIIGRRPTTVRSLVFRALRRLRQAEEIRDGRT